MRGVVLRVVTVLVRATFNIFYGRLFCFVLFLIVDVISA